MTKSKNIKGSKPPRTKPKITIPKENRNENQNIVRYRDPNFRVEQAILRRSRTEELVSLFAKGQLTLDKQRELQLEWKLSDATFTQLLVIAKETIQHLANPVSVYLQGCNFFDLVEKDCLDSRINGQLDNKKVINVLNAYKIKFAAVGLNQLRLNQSTEDINKLEKELTDKIINKLKSDGTIKEEDQEDIPDITNG